MSCLRTHTRKPAVFLDRDGVINQNRPDHVKDWAEFAFLPGVLKAMESLARIDALIVVVTNQAAIARGMVARETVESINQSMLAEIVRSKGRVDGIYYCPHHPGDDCVCRKPKPGLLIRAAQELGIDLGRSYLVGDALSDVDAALAVGVTPILVLTGRGQQESRHLPERELPVSTSCWIVKDLGEAVYHLVQVFPIRPACFKSPFQP